MLALSAVALVALAAIAALTIVTLRSRMLPGPSLASKTVVIHTVLPDDQTLRGVVVAHHSDRMTLRDVVYMHPSGDQPTGGLVHVPTRQISWFQEIEPELHTPVVAED